MHYLSQVCQTKRVPFIAFTRLLGETSSPDTSSKLLNHSVQLRSVQTSDYIYTEGVQLLQVQDGLHGPFALFCLFSSNCDASFNMSVASLCMFSLDRATACM